MTALAPPIWELAGVPPAASALEDHRRRVSFRELEERTNALGHGLEALGAEPGDHVAWSRATGSSSSSPCWVRCGRDWW